jgi:hypothetical protein
MSSLGFLLGALSGTFVISRLFWLVTKRWPDDYQKALFLNGVSGVLIILADYLVRPNADFILEVLVYGSCQIIVLLYDLWRIAGKRENKLWIILTVIGATIIVLVIYVVTLVIGPGPALHPA